LAGTLEVTPEAAFTGGYGLEVSVDSCDSTEDFVLSDQTITGPVNVEACDSVTAGSGVEVTATGNLTLIAGESVTIRNGFSVRTGGSLAVGASPSNGPYAYVEDDSPRSETTYEAEFWVNLDGLTLGAGDAIEHFVAYSSTGIERFRVIVRRGPVVKLQVRNDAGTYYSTPDISVPSGWSKIAVKWEASPSAVASIVVNSGSPRTLSGLNTQYSRIDFTRWGSVGGTLIACSGEMKLDEFAAFR